MENKYEYLMDVCINCSKIIACNEADYCSGCGKPKKTREAIFVEKTIALIKGV